MKYIKENKAFYLILSVLIIILISSTIVFYNPTRKDFKLRLDNYKYSEINKLFLDISKKIDTPLNELWFETGSLLIQNNEIKDFRFFSFSKEHYSYYIKKYSFTNEEGRVDYYIEVDVKYSKSISSGLISLNRYLLFLENIIIDNSTEITSIDYGHTYFSEDKIVNIPTYQWINNEFVDISSIKRGDYLYFSQFVSYKNNGSYSKAIEYYIGPIGVHI